MSKLGSLPPSSDEYWEGADKLQIKPTPSPKCNHFFRMIKGGEVQCQCGIGFFLDRRSTLKQGKIYIDGKLAV